MEAKEKKDLLLKIRQRREEIFWLSQESESDEEKEVLEGKIEILNWVQKEIEKL